MKISNLLFFFLVYNCIYAQNVTVGGKVLVVQPPYHLNIIGNGYLTVKPISDIPIDYIYQSCCGISVTDTDGAFECSCFPGSQLVQIQPDDLNNSSTCGLNSEDLLLMGNYIVGNATGPTINPVSGLATLAMDATRDNKVSGADIVEIRKTILGIPSNMPDYNYIITDPAHISAWELEYSSSPSAGANPNPHEDNYYNYGSVLENQSNDFYAVKVGDVYTDDICYSSTALSLKETVPTEIRTNDLESVTLDFIYDNDKIYVNNAMNEETHMLVLNFKINQDDLSLKSIKGMEKCGDCFSQDGEDIKIILFNEEGFNQSRIAILEFNSYVNPENISLNNTAVNKAIIGSKTYNLAYTSLNNYDRTKASLTVNAGEQYLPINNSTLYSIDGNFAQSFVRGIPENFPTVRGIYVLVNNLSGKAQKVVIK